ncbi:MAG: inositol monophosphatase [Planctomycetota bacterium]
MNREEVGDDLARAMVSELRWRFSRSDRRGQDEALERAFRDRIRAHFPTDAILGEEIEREGPVWSGTGWIVDPLDGTANFEAGIPVFCATFAYCVNDSPELGWVADPMGDAVWKARLDAGAWRNDARLPTRATREGRRIVALSSQWRRREVDRVRVLARRARDRTFGALALELCWVADRRLAAGVWDSARAWDLAAGSLIASEAGAIVETLAGRPLSFVGPEESLRERQYSLAAWFPEERSALESDVRGSGS